jgi:DNA-binding beta-propeller fold protein YncE
MKLQLAACIAAVALTPAGAGLAAPAYAPAGSVALGAPDRWDYVVFDPGSGRVYVAHGDRVAVIDGRAGTVVGEVTGIAGGTHGTGISAKTGQGFTDDGRNGLAVAFDLETLKVTRQLPAGEDADAIAVDPVSGHVFVMHGDPKKMSVIDPKSDTIIANIDAGEKLEYAAADGKGFIYVSGAGSRDFLKVDARTNQIVGRWATPDCTSPHGMAVDPVAHRAFMGCINGQLMVLDTRDGRIVAKLPIGRGSDALAFDPGRRRVFSSNGVDGTITVYQEVSSDRYEALEPVPTSVTGRTMDVDPQTGRLFVAAADVDPPATPGGAPRRKPGSLRLMMFDPVN